VHECQRVRQESGLSDEVGIQHPDELGTASPPFVHQGPERSIEVPCLGPSSFIAGEVADALTGAHLGDPGACPVVQHANLE
jgi:hypothetical protein